MEIYRNETSEDWARKEFGACRLGDRRRTERAVQLSAAMLAAPGKSLPQQMRRPSLLKAAYRFMNEEGITYPALMRPHWEQTRGKLRDHRVVLLVHDLTEIDYTAFPSTEGLGPIGDGGGQGYLLSTVLAVVPSPRQVLGIAHQEPFLRRPRPKGETRTQTARRPKESDFWQRGVQAIGACPAGQWWVHVGDRGSDVYGFLQECRQQNCHFLIRACYSRKMVAPDGSVSHVLSFAQQLPALEERVLHLPAGHGHPARQAKVRLAFSPLSVCAPWSNRRGAPIQAWVIRIWEMDPDPTVAEPIDWYLLTSLPVETVEQAWECVAWYCCRWLIEDFHMCLKTGCQIEQRRLQQKDRLLRLLGLLAPVAVHLLQLRELSRLEPERLAKETVSADILRLVAHLAHRDPDSLTVLDFWRFVAQQGGYLGRKGDSPPGWKSLWSGWLYLQNLLRGVHLAEDLNLGLL